MKRRSCKICHSHGWMHIVGDKGWEPCEVTAPGAKKCWGCPHANYGKAKVK